MHRVPWLVVLLIVCLGAQALTQVTVAAPAPGTGNPPDIAERYRPDPVKWRPCPENATLECGTLTLPVDYREPHGETFELAVLRARATDPARRIGVLMTNPGGPGVSGVDNLLRGIAFQAPIIARLRERFDIIGFDVRGSHRSRAVRCDVEPAGAPGTTDDAALASFFNAFGRRVAQACLEQNGQFITTLSTNTNARDMDTLRRALGEKQLSYAGSSFGTTLGAVYASLFPQRVRAMVLDAGVAPEFHDSLVEFWTEHSASFEVAFRRLDQLCQRDSACRLREPGVLAAFDAVTAKLKSAPVASDSGAVLTDVEVRNVVGELLYFERRWPLIVDALTNSLADDYALFFQLIPVFAPTGEDGIPLALDTRTFTAHTAILCNDYGTRRDAADYLSTDEAIGAMHSRLYGRFFVASGVARCASWPAADVPIIRNVAERLDTPIVLIGNDFDNATPLSWTRSLAFALGMERSVVRYAGGGHGVASSGNPCTDDTIVAYLTEGRLPPEGLVCPAQPIPFGPSAQANAASLAAATLP